MPKIVGICGSPRKGAKEDEFGMKNAADLGKKVAEMVTLISASK